MSKNKIILVFIFVSILYPNSGKSQKIDSLKIQNIEELNLTLSRFSKEVIYRDSTESKYKVPEILKYSLFHYYPTSFSGIRRHPYND